ncbi:MAG TPA: type II toxin-antitoxin system PemK/MazF family toxin [Bryobacteraceae bacterium]
MPFHTAPGAKVRPAVILLDRDDDVVAAPVTSQERNSSYDLRIENWREAGLNVASWLRVHKVAVLLKADILRPLGTLGDGDRVSLGRILCRAFCPDGARGSG